MDEMSGIVAAVQRTRQEWDLFRRLRRCAGPFADPQTACSAWNRMEAAVRDLEGWLPGLEGTPHRLTASGRGASTRPPREPSR